MTGIRDIRTKRNLRHACIAAIVCVALFCRIERLPAQGAGPDGQGPLSDVLPKRPVVLAAVATRECINLPVRPPEDRLVGPHGGSLVTKQCEVLADQVTGADLPEGWTTLRYRWNSSFTAEDKTRGPAARDTVTEEEVVLFEATEPGKLRPVWHARFETGDYAVWRSITPEIARTRQGTTLLGVMSCVNGTGGCSQDFLQRQRDGRWREVKQAWLDQLPTGFKGRIRHGVRIDIQSLKGEAGFYGDNDPNCCASQVLKVDLALRDDSLILLRQTVVAAP